MIAFGQLWRVYESEALAGQPLRVLGIDLGTTNSTVAEVTFVPGHTHLHEPRCIPIEQETDDGLYTHVLVPSVVASGGGRVLVGEGAKRRRAQTHSKDQDLFWDCKNDIGTKRVYRRAPAGLRSPREVGGHVLRRLIEAARTYDDAAFDRIVVTVPASFQAAQRRDTQEAARLAGLEIVGGDLLDEPVAAFLDFALTQGLAGLAPAGESKNLFVFDFGGGTCDVAAFRVRWPRDGYEIEVAPRAVSRYHRLGGGDIDAGIVYDVLLPQIRVQNRLGGFDLGYEDKKRLVEPAFLSVAEGLKISMCKEVARLRKLGRHQGEQATGVKVALPGHFECRLGSGRVLSLRTPEMTAAQFLKVLEPFLDREALWTRETEFRTTASIFAPLSDALDRCGLAPTDIDFCLLVGGSSLIPYVQDAIRDYLTAARLLTFPDAETVQTAVARGAAYHALSLAVTGRGLVRPVTGNALQIQTQDGPVELIPTGSSLPYPSTPGAWAECRSLAIPQTGRGEPVELRVELLDGDGARTAHHLWSVAAPVRKGDPLLLKYRMDENQTLEVVMHLDGRPGEAEFQCKFENPLTTVVNPAVEREKIFALEELLATKQAPRAMWTHLMRRLAKLYESLGQCERALQWMKKAAKCSDRPDAGLLNRMGILCDRLRDYERSERYYREGADLDDDDGACLFNLSLSQQRRGLLREATSSIDEAILRDRKPAYLVLKAELCGATQRPADKASFLAEALESFAAPVSLDDWGLTWFRQAARLAGDTGLVADADREQDRRSDGEDTEQLTGHAPLLQHAGRE